MSGFVTNELSTLSTTMGGECISNIFIDFRRVSEQVILIGDCSLPLSKISRQNSERVPINRLYLGLPLENGSSPISNEPDYCETSPATLGH